jgi:hypothetical protein
VGTGAIAALQSAGAAGLGLGAKATLGVVTGAVTSKLACSTKARKYFTLNLVFPRKDLIRTQGSNKGKARQDKATLMSQSSTEKFCSQWILLK